MEENFQEALAVEKEMNESLRHEQKDLGREHEVFVFSCCPLLKLLPLLSIPSQATSMTPDPPEQSPCPCSLDSPCNQ